MKAKRGGTWGDCRIRDRVQGMGIWVIWAIQVRGTRRDSRLDIVMLRVGDREDLVGRDAELLLDLFEGVVEVAQLGFVRPDWKSVLFCEVAPKRCEPS